MTETRVQVYEPARQPSPPGLADRWPRRAAQLPSPWPDPSDPETEVQEVRGGFLIRRWERVR